MRLLHPQFCAAGGSGSCSPEAGEPPPRSRRGQHGCWTRGSQAPCSHIEPNEKCSQGCREDLQVLSRIGSTSGFWLPALGEGPRLSLAHCPEGAALASHLLQALQILLHLSASPACERLDSHPLSCASTAATPRSTGFGSREGILLRGLLS